MDGVYTTFEETEDGRISFVVPQQDDTPDRELADILEDQHITVTGTNLNLKGVVKLKVWQEGKKTVMKLYDGEDKEVHTKGYVFITMTMDVKPGMRVNVDGKWMTFEEVEGGIRFGTRF